MPVSFLNRTVSKRPIEGKLRLPKLEIPDFDRFITAEAPAISVQLAPALEDLAALTDGIPTDLQQQIETLLTAQIGTAIPGAAVVSTAIGEKPDYALLRADPDSLSDKDKGRLLAEGLKLLGRRQNFGIYLAPEGKSGIGGRIKGTGQIDLNLDITALIDKTGAPFEMRILAADVTKAVNTMIAAEAPRFSLQGEACDCGPVSVQSIAFRNPSAGKLETVVSGQLDLLLGAAHAEFALIVNETLAVDDRGSLPGELAEPAPSASINVTKIIGTELPEKVKKFLERDVVQALIQPILPLRSLIAIGLRALASRLASNRIDDPAAPIHDALEGVLAPQMVRGTDQKIFFDLQRATTPAGAISLAGVVLVVPRRQALRIRAVARGRRVEGDTFELRFRASTTDMVEPVRYTWTCLGEEFTGGPDATFRVDLAAHPEFPVTVEAVDGENFPAPPFRMRFRKGPVIAGRMLLAGEPVRR